MKSAPRHETGDEACQKKEKKEKTNTIEKQEMAEAATSENSGDSPVFDRIKLARAVVIAFTDSVGGGVTESALTMKILVMQANLKSALRHEFGDKLEPCLDLTGAPAVCCIADSADVGHVGLAQCLGVSDAAAVLRSQAEAANGCAVSGLQATWRLGGRSHGEMSHV